MEPELELDTPIEISKYLAQMKKRVRAENEFENLKKLKEELLTYYSEQELPPSTLLERYRKLAFRQKLPTALHLSLLAAVGVTLFRHLLFPTSLWDGGAIVVAVAVGAVLLWDRAALRVSGSRPALWAFEMAIIKTKLWEEHGYCIAPTVKAYWEGEKLVYREPDRED